MLYYQRRHGKGPCDQRFGQHRKVWASTALFSIDQFGYAIQNRINASDNSKPESCTIVPGTALSDWKSFFTVRSHHGVLPADERCKIMDNEYNQVFAVRTRCTACARPPVVVEVSCDVLWVKNIHTCRDTNGRAKRKSRWQLDKNLRLADGRLVPNRKSEISVNKAVSLKTKIPLRATPP